MDHERCSELLPAFERGELDAPAASSVRDHLSSCPDCTLELEGIRALNAVAVEPMTAQERGLVHRRIAEATAGPETQTILAPAKRGFWARLAPALGGIALVAVVVTGAALMGGGGDDMADTAGGGGDGGMESEAPAASGDQAAEESAAPADDGDDANVTWAGDIGTVSERELARDVRRDRFPNSARSAFLTDSAGAALESAKSTESVSRYSLVALQDEAGGETAQQIADCAETVTDALPYPTVPVYGAIAELDGRMVLLLGFNWAEEDDQALDEVMLWAWPVGDCAVPVFYGSGTARD